MQNTSHMEQKKLFLDEGRLFCSARTVSAALLISYCLISYFVSIYLLLTLQERGWTVQMIYHAMTSLPSEIEVGEEEVKGTMCIRMAEDSKAEKNLLLGCLKLSSEAKAFYCLPDGDSGLARISSNCPCILSSVNTRQDPEGAPSELVLAICQNALTC